MNHFASLNDDCLNRDISILFRFNEFKAQSYFNIETEIFNNNVL